MLSKDINQGFEMTSIKAALVAEWLNEVFGPCGIGGCHVHRPFEQLHIDNVRTDIVPEVAFQCWYRATCEYTGAAPTRDA